MFKKFKKFVASLLLVTLNIFGTPSLAFAQEITDTPIEPTAEVTIAPENTPEPTVAPTEIPVIVTDTPTPEPTAEPTLEPTPIEVTPTDIPTPTEEAPVAQSPPVDTSTPTVEAVQPQKPEETLTAVILENTSASSALDLILDEPVTAPSATLVTDKADYAPTDSVLITGSNFAPNASYTIYITSETEGYVFSDTVTADDQGNIVYTHQLDGTYRPDYKVEVKLSETVVATATFTDTQPINPVIAYATNLVWPDTWSTPNSCLSDPANDENPGNIDLIGDSSEPSLYTVGFSSDPNFQYFRERVNGDPGSPGSWVQKAWVVLFQTTAPNYQFLGSLNGKDDKVELYKNTNEAGAVDFSPLLNDPADDVIWSQPAVSYSRVTSVGGGIYYVDWAIPQSAFTTTGVTPTTTKFFATSADANNFNKDHLKCYEIMADLSITKTDNPDPIYTGSQLTYTLAIHNAGPDTAGGVVVTDTLPSGFGVISITPSQGSCSDTVAPNLQCELGSITSGSSATITVIVTTSGTGLVTNTASVSSDPTLSLDSNSSNNSDSEDTTLLDAKGTLIVKKILTKDNGGDAKCEDFSFSYSAAAAIPFESDCQNDITVNSGTYTITESAFAGYSPTYANCQNITVPNGGSVTCTITNDDQPGTLIVKKVLINDNGGIKEEQDFSFKVNNGDNIGFEADGQNDITVNAGTYTIVENSITGYTTTYDNCTDVVIPNGGTSTCTITNDDQPGTLIVKKIVNNNYGGTKTAGQFVFSVNAGSDIPFEADGQNNLTVDAGIYTISEPSVYGYSPSFDNCTNISVSNGGTATCTITNNDIQPKLTVIKHVIPDNGGQETAASFTMTVSGNDPNPTSFAGDENGTLVLFQAGSYSVSEDGPIGYSSNFSTDCSGTINVGDTKVCTITNDDQAPTLTLVKTVTNDNGGDKKVSDFPLFINGIPTTSGVPVVLTSNVEYTASETNQSGYSASVWGTDCSPDGKITLKPGENKTCSITNDDIQPQLTITKVVVNKDNGNLTVNDFPLFVDQTQVISGVAHAFNVGSYVVSETNQDGYSAQITGNCDAQGNITLTVGDNKSCTITNTDQLGKIFIEKQTLPDGSGQVFGFKGDVSGQIKDGEQLFQIVLPGIYSVSENIQTGWDLTSAVCSDGSSVDNINISPNETVTCTFTNTQLGSIAGQKWHDLDADGIMDQTEPMLNGWTIFIDGNGNKVLDAGEVSTTTATDNQNNQGEYLLENLTPATYSVCEVDQNGWKRTVPASSNCQDAVVTAGQTTYDIRFGNVQYGSVTGMKWHDLNMDGVKDANEPGLQDWQIFLFPDLTSRKITDVKTDANGYYLMENIIPGQYLVCEVGSPSTIQSWIQSYPLTGSKRDEFYCHQINVTAGQEIEDVDFGNYQYNSITVTKYYDRDDDYEMDATGEEVLSGWDLTLRDEAGAVVGSGTTDPNGQVKFENLIPDRYYYLSETQQAGWRLTSINCDDGLADDSTNNRRTTLDAGNNISCTVGNIRNPVKLSAQKVVCDTEADLPDWGGDRSHVINASTAQAWVDQSNGNCRLENQWTFQWAPAGSGSIGDFAVNTSSLGAPWTTFTAGETVEFNDTSSLGGRIEVREIIPENYAPLIGFSGEPGSVGKSVSAEIYCTGDVYNYDNWDWVNNPQYGSHYYCVAFNALAYASITVDKITDPADDPTSFSIYLKQGDTTVKEFNLTGSENPETFDTLIPGTYSITESVPNGWMNNSWACTINGQPVTSNLELVIGAGDEVSCSFTNTKLGTIVSYKYQDTNANHQFDGDATEPRLNGWTISLFDDSWNLLDSMQTGDSTTPNGEVEPGHYQFKYRSPGTYYVCETGKTGWTQTFPITGVQKDGLYCHTVNLSAGQLKYGIPFGNVQLSDIHGYKWNDLNGDGIRNCSTETVLNREFRFEPICNEPLLPGWTIFIDSNKDGLLSEGEKSMVTSDLPDHLGWYWFEDLLPGEYRICEVGQSGWQQTSTPVCHNVILPYSTQFLATVPTTLNYIQEPTPEFNFGNIFVNPRLTISKSNDAVGDKRTGESVVYTLTVKVLDGLLKGVYLVDLLPSGFTYRSGSWIATKNTLAYSIPEPVYASPGTWYLGDLAKDDEVVLTYIADIGGAVLPGTYKDVAWASGEDTLKNVHLAEAIDPGYLSTNFVGTSVKIVGGTSVSGGYQGQSETKVLGAATELPLTGTPTFSTIFAAFLIIAGFATVIYSRKTKKHVH